MIELARVHAPEARFEVADATRFRSRTKFHGAVSTFDSLNHFLVPADLSAALGRVSATLKPGAPFAFDILLEAAYHTDWADNFSLVRDDHVLVISGSGFDFRTRMAHCRITTFRRTGKQWRRADTVVQERCYSAEEIDTALREAGFANPACYTHATSAWPGSWAKGGSSTVAEAT